jgi:hypothetical protein
MQPPLEKHVVSLQRLTETEVSRKEFLTYLGALFLGVIGVSNVLKTLRETPQKKERKSAGYGMGTYGDGSRIR